MRVLDATSGESAVHASPEWVADWWMPAASIEPVEADLDALLAPEPLPVIEVVGRAAAVEEEVAAG